MTFTGSARSGRDKVLEANVYNAQQRAGALAACPPATWKTTLHEPEDPKTDPATFAHHEHAPGTAHHEDEPRRAGGLACSPFDIRSRHKNPVPNEITPSWLLDLALVPALRATILRPVVALNRIRIRPPARWSRSLALPFVAPLSIDRRRNQIGDAKMCESALAKARKRGVNGGGGRRRI